MLQESRQNNSRLSISRGTYRFLTPLLPARNLCSSKHRKEFTWETFATFYLCQCELNTGITVRLLFRSLCHWALTEPTQGEGRAARAASFVPHRPDVPLRSLRRARRCHEAQEQEDAEEASNSPTVSARQVQTCVLTHILQFPTKLVPSIQCFYRPRLPRETTAREAERGTRETGGSPPDGADTWPGSDAPQPPSQDSRR